MPIQIRRTRTPNLAPTGLLPGQLSVEMASQPPRLWIGVPSNIDPLLRREFAPYARSRVWSPGDVKLTFKQVADPGWIIVNDGSVGSALSGATTRANDDTIDLFKTLHETFLVPGDDLFSSVVLLIGNEQGPIGNTTTFVNQASNGRPIILSGGTPPIWAAPPVALPYGALTSVLNFRAAGNYLYMAAHADWNFGNQPFCIEFYARPTTNTVNNRWQAVLADGSGWINLHADSGQWQARLYIGSTYTDYVPFGAATQNQWSHVALYRIGNQFYGARNGVPVLLFTAAGVVNASNGAMWLSYAEGFNIFVGQIAGVRITKGVSRYTAQNFTPPSLPLLGSGVVGTQISLQDSNGAAVITGASPADDFAANRRIVIPKMLGRALAIAGSGAGLSVRNLGDALGQEAVGLNTNLIPSHAHTLVPHYTYAAQGGGGVGYTLAGAGNTSIEGGSLAHNSMQPTSFLNVMMCL